MPFSVLHIPEGRQVLRHRVEEGSLQCDDGRVRGLRRQSGVHGEWRNMCIQRYFDDDENQIFGAAVIN